jgi:stearoyl-CoA desaturase (delta-9 desaturase)
MIGRRPYSKEITARDSTLIAVFTFGEGYHNYHHKFQVDYRNGIHWFHWDPTKWLIYALSAVGLTSKLKRVPATEILKAKMLAEEEKLLNNGIPLEKINYVRERILEAQKGMKNLRDEYNRLSLELKSSSVRMQDSSRKHLADLQAEVAKRRRDLELARLEFKSAIKQWRILATA